MPFQLSRKAERQLVAAGGEGARDLGSDRPGRGGHVDRELALRFAPQNGFGEGGIGDLPVSAHAVEQTFERGQPRRVFQVRFRGGKIDRLKIEPQRAGIADKVEMIVLPGGMPGADNLENSPEVQAAIDYCAENDKWISAICAAPKILGHKGLLAGTRCTCFPGYEKALKNAILCPDSVVEDGRFVTAKGAGAALKFALKLVEVLYGKDDGRELECKRFEPYSIDIGEDASREAPKYNVSDYVDNGRGKAKIETCVESYLWFERGKKHITLLGLFPSSSLIIARSSYTPDVVVESIANEIVVTNSFDETVQKNREVIDTYCKALGMH